MFHLRSADSKGQCAKSTVGRCVGVSADNGHAGLCHSQLGPDDVHHTLVTVPQRMDAHTEFGCIPAQGLHLGTRDGIRDRREDVQRGGVVILGRQGQVRATHFTTVHPQALEGLWASDLMHQVQVDVEKIGFVIDRTHNVRIPNLLGQGLPHFTLPYYDRSMRASLQTWRHFILRVQHLKR